jgi:hypothetical protein
VVVFSLHGMGPNTSQEHFVPRIMDRVNAAWARTDPHASTASPASPGLVRRLRELVPAGVQNAIARAVPVAVRDEVMNRQITGGRDWAATPGFALLADLNGYLRWNVRGRERDGALEPDGAELRRYAAWVRECFAGLRIDGSGEPLCAEVVAGDDAFAGPRADRLPDLVVTWYGGAPVSRVRSDVLGTIGAELATGRGGNHRSRGFCAILGSEEARAHTAGLRHIADLASLVTERLLPPS